MSRDVDNRLKAESRTLRVGLIGCGKMGVQHLKAISRTKTAIIVGVADPFLSEEAIRPFVPPSARLVTDVTTLLNEVRPDVVHVVTPYESHAAITAQALKAGCHVYVEKPFVPTLAEARRLYELATERNLQIVAGHQVLFELPAIRAEQMLPSIGRLVYVESHFSFRMVRRTISLVEQCKDILPHAIYPLLRQLRAASTDSEAAVEVLGVDARATGDIHALLRIGERTGIVTVTLSGRPVEQYQYLVGTNGSLRADYITGSLIHLSGPGAGLGVLFTPYRRALQTVGGATRGFAKLIFGKQTSYPGLQALIEGFYNSILNLAPPPLSQQEVLDTVGVCERLGRALDVAEMDAEAAAHRRLAEAEELLPSIDESKPGVLVTGGTGMLGRPVAMELRASGIRTRVLARRLPAASRRIPGVEYVSSNLADGLTPDLLQGIGTVVHCAAETAGGKVEQEKNSIAATRAVLDGARRAGVRRVIHISSLAVLRPAGHGNKLLDESSPVDAGNLERGPYVWGKAESEVEAQRLAADYGVSLKVIRPGPLVDFDDYNPPGRLGREVGPWFFAVGSRRAGLSVCDVWTAARVIRFYVDNFSSAPPILNMIEGQTPTREQLVSRLIQHRSDLRVWWVPDLLVRLANGPAKLAQRLLLHSTKPVDVYSAFASERYRTDLAATVIRQAGPSATGR